MQTKQKTQRFTKDVNTDQYSSHISCPEYVAQHIAQTAKQLAPHKTAIEMCSCIGALCFQLAKTYDHVTGIELLPDRVAKSKENASIYGVSENTEFIVGDVLDEKLLSTLQADIAFLDPEWSKVKMDPTTFAHDIDSTHPSLREMIKLTKKYLTDEIVIRFPANMDFASFDGCNLGPGKIETIVINGLPMFKVGYFLKSIKENETEEIRFE